MDDLTDYERRLTLGALWNFRNSLERDYDKAMEGTADDVTHKREFMAALDSAARKLGGDPSEHMYGAPRF